MNKKEKYKQLLNGCYRTEIAVYPANWQTQKAPITKKGKNVEWYVWYRFYDPAHRDQHPNGKLIKRRRMNKYMDLISRQTATEELLALEKEKVDIQHFNPITEKYMQPPAPPAPVKDKRPVTPNTGLIDALDWAYENISPAPNTLHNIRLCLAAIWLAAEQLGLHNKPIGQVEKADMRLILDQIGRNKDTWTANNFNYHKGHLGMLFFFLEDYDVFKINPIKSIKRKMVVRKEAQVLDDQKLQHVMQEMKAFDYYYWRLLRIFQESGCRRPEILGVQYSQVDLNNRRFMVLVKKDKEYKEVWKEIDSSVLHLWREVMQEAEKLWNEGGEEGEQLYLYCEGLRPQWRAYPLAGKQLTTRWRVHVKKKLGVTENFYRLKHKRTTRDIDKFVDAAIKKAQKKAAKKNSHTSTAMVEKVYDVNQGRRSAIIRQLKMKKHRKRKAVVLRMKNGKIA